jgi:hemerythrin HHE cation binding domain-containing protein
VNTSDTKTYRRQHGEIVKLVQGVQAFLLPGSLPGAAHAARLKLSELAAKVDVHLAMEDGSLYPALMAHNDPRVRDTASRFNNEMSGVRAVFEVYRTKWTESAIRADSAGFIEETNRLFAALANRINRENTELYPLLERKGPAEPKR